MRIRSNWIHCAAKLAAVWAVAAVTSANANALQVEGEIDFETRVDLIALTKGTVTSVNAEVGDVVESGTVLIELDSRRQQAWLSIRQSAVERSEISVNETQEEFDRQQELFDRGSLSLTDYQSIVNNLKRVQASLIESQAKLDLAKYRLDQTMLSAPFDAIVESRRVEPGMNIVRADSPSLLMTLAQAGRYVLRIEVTSDLRESLNAGDAAEVVVGDRRYSAIVKFDSLQPISKASEPLYPVSLRFEETDEVILPGTPASAVFE